MNYPERLNTAIPNDKRKISGESLYGLIEELYPICRSITGDGLRKSLQIIQEKIPLNICELPTGTSVFDWTIPKEWNINDAWIKNSKGEKIVDFNESNLHIVNYSIPVDKNIRLDELKAHLHSIPDEPELVPYRTSYYEERWGFCLSHNQLESLRDDVYHVYIDSSLKEGSMSYGELLIEGETEEEVLITAHICHPSLCNDNLSGVSVAVHLAESLLDEDCRYSYRFLFIPSTIGAIAWLALHEENIDKVRHGLVLACVGDTGNVTYKTSRHRQAEIDRIAEYVLNESGDPYDIRPFSPTGNERQFSSPAFNLPVGCFMRTPFGEFPEYHTSADDLSFVKPGALADSFSKLKKMIDVIENNGTYLNLNPKCEPNLGSRGLYSTSGGRVESKINQEAILWVLNYTDGEHSLLDIAEMSGLNFKQLKQAVVNLERVNLLKRLS
ncbi:MAG TPA: DUF4910 domain-containing protein [Balneolaceae bacterium]|nr:DUF4910 domain-containing protein [Balneolaceae bacterium]